MKKMNAWVAMAALMASAALPLAAQRPALGGRGAGGPGGFSGGFGGGLGIERLDGLVGLSDSQETAIKAIYDAAKAQAEPLRAQIRTSHENVEAAVKANKSDGEIEQLTAQQGTLTAQMAAIHAKARRQVWQQLTAEQRAKLDEMQTRMKERMTNRQNRRAPAQQ
ncbi:MAG TPA: Spy/CpxP family protein refolding chaperone [Bryobacteraceae bacterium]|nr:Spy/CpxP family protein refolding chaperone [Bryobacteraceae bacterium]